ncbi:MULTISPECIES: phage tail protein [unclassified Enterobacter cloacae complex]|uniref:phage tail-collar fiber domain-containing protein n=1 Tax=unclassified Enterobacter cloacae complex TaxID=2757714 RepID=UPI003AAA2C10
MAQTVITKAFTEWKAQQAIDNQPVNLDEFIFAYIPDLDVTKPIENTEGLPPADKIVHRQAVSKSGVVNANSVVYSVTLGADVGDFNFNWIGLANKETGTLAMIIHAPTQSKIKNASGQQGNVLVRSMLMEYSGAESATNITTPAETWQIDFTARLAAMDERQRRENIDLYGMAAFFDSGYLVAKSGAQYYVTKGAGYVAGLRAELAANQNITVSAKPVKVWLDVSWSGTLTSEWAVKSKITVAASLADYVENGSQHYVFAVASIDASGNITDLRPKGSLNDQSIKEHEKSRNHPDATTTEKGFTKLSSAVDSESETEAATPKAVKAANDNANGRVPSGRKVNGRALTEDINITSQDIFNGQAVLIGNAADLNSFTTPGLYYQSSNAQAQAGTNYPEAVAGSLEVYKHAGVTQVYRIYADSRSYIRIFYNGAWTSWAKQYDAANKPTPGDIGAVPASGGSVAHLENATYYKINPAGWYGSGTFADQYRNNAAPFLVPYGFVSTKDASQYLPIVKGISHTAVHGYAASVSFGILRSGKADFGSAVIHIIGDNGASAMYSFDATGAFNAPRQIYSAGDIIAAGQVSSGANIVAGQGLYESGGAVRVYSSNNPPTQYAVRDWITSVGLEANNPSAPYMRQESSGNMVRLATQGWVNGSFATSAWTIANFLQGGIRLASAGVATNGNNDNEFAYAPNGTVVTAVQQKTNYTAVQYRSLQYNIGGNWYTAWVA